jgi:hypothetical protein
MAIDCRCPACGANLEVAEKHAGREVECPQCAGTVVVPDAQSREKLPVARPIAPPRRRPPVAPVETPPADSAEVIAGADQTAAHPADAAGGGFPNIVVDPAAGWPAGRRGSRKIQTTGARKPKSKTGRPVWLAASFVLAVVVAAVLIDRLGGGRLTSWSEERSSLVLDWPESERGGAAVLIDNRRQELPRSGPVEYTVKPGPHCIVLRRRGYEQLETRVSLTKDQRHRYKPRWTQLVVTAFEPEHFSKPAGAWLQDMEVAKRKAAEQNKDILIAFEGSDWNDKSMRMRDEIFSQRAFRERVDWRFVLVSIDFPRKAEAKAQVEDPQRNKRLAESYHVSKYPTVVLTDAEGRPFAVVGYVDKDVEDFLGRVTLWQEVREHLHGLFLNVEMSEGDQQFAAIEKAAALLTRSLLSNMELVSFYGATLDQWLALVKEGDKDNKKGAYGAVFGVNWLARLAEVEEKDLDGIRRVIAELDDWKQKHDFKDPDRGALMHLYAAGRLKSAEQETEALEYIEKARGYEPEDAWLVFMLRQMEAYIRGYGGGSGSGFVVAADGNTRYVLTNHHVVKGEGKASVRLPGREESVPAKVIAKNSDRDMALLKMEVPEGIELEPLHVAAEEVAAEEVAAGAEIGVFGFPLGVEFGTEVTFTWGHVGRIREEDEERMLILDCRVNPGNSGGPICNTQGHVIGMVTLKIGGWGMDSYGVALPAEDLRAFLKKHLPEYEKQQSPEAGQSRLEWDEINRIVSPSVVMIVKSG